jgi:hypothetical protein
MRFVDPTSKTKLHKNQKLNFEHTHFFAMIKMVSLKKINEER